MTTTPNPCGNFDGLPVIPGVSPEVVAIAADLLEPPEFDEFCAAFCGKTSAPTRAYWLEKARMFQAWVDEDAEVARHEAIIYPEELAQDLFGEQAD